MGLSLSSACVEVSISSARWNLHFSKALHMPVTQFIRQLTRDDAKTQKSLLAGRLCGQVPVESGDARYYICLSVAAAFSGNIMMSDGPL